MKTLKPLAAALFLLSSPAAAQLLTGPSGGGGFSFGGAGSLASQASPVTDFTFRCGTPPWKACTDVEMNQRQPILMARQCPAPVTAACTDFLMRELGASNPAETIAAYTPPPGREWASPDCQRIPCRLADAPSSSSPRPAPGAGAVESGLPYDQQPGFIGPPAPSRNQGPQPFTDENSFRQAMREQENLTPGKVVDLGNNTYAVDTGDGNYSIGGLCSGAPCSGMPKPADQIPGLADALQLANSINNGNKNAFGPTSTPAPSGGSRRSSQGADTPPADDIASNSTEEAQGSGGDAGRFFRSNGGGGGATAGGTTDGSYAATAASGQDGVIAAQAASLDEIQATHIGTQKFQTTAEEILGGAKGTFTEKDPNAGGDLKYKGTQSGLND
ncbi:MAG: hypothetical protein Q8T11_16650 [Elusimicrobiota bacterium]|nr:hypothetical protein [Elusimicrobiota bacterium]